MRCASWMVTAMLLCGLTGAEAQQQAATATGGNLQAVLREMDAASARFRSAEADFRWDYYQRVVRDTTTQTGTIYFLKSGGTLQMGAKVNPPEAKTLEYKAGKLMLFDPSQDHVTELSAGANQSTYESFLTLGFGGSGKDLEKTWTITDEGQEQMSDGGSGMVKVEKLDLIPKDANVRNTFTHVTIWVDPARGVSLKQVFFMPSQDVRTATYTHVRVNEKVDLGRFAIKTDKNTTYDRR